MNLRVEGVAFFAKGGKLVLFQRAVELIRKSLERAFQVTVFIGQFQVIKDRQKICDDLGLGGLDYGLAVALGAAAVVGVFRIQTL